MENTIRKYFPLQLPVESLRYHLAILILTPGETQLGKHNCSGSVACANRFQDQLAQLGGATLPLILVFTLQCHFCATYLQHPRVKAFLKRLKTGELGGPSNCLAGRVQCGISDNSPAAR